MDAVAVYAGKRLVGYEVRLRGASVRCLEQHYSPAEILLTPRETVLLPEVEHPVDLRPLLTLLLSMGVTLNKVHEVAARTSATVQPRPGRDG